MMIKWKRLPGVVLLLPALCSCATDAQRNARAMRAEVISVVRDGVSCALAANASPDLVPLWHHIPRPPAAPSLDQLGDASYATPTDIQLIKIWHDRITPCRERAIQSLSGIDGRMSNVISDITITGDQIELGLAQGRLTWGEANRQIQTNRVSAQRQMLSVINQINGEFIEQDAAERDRRAEVMSEIGQGLAAAAQAAATVAVTAEAIQEERRASRPVVTTCNQILFNTTCVSQ